MAKRFSAQAGLGPFFRLFFSSASPASWPLELTHAPSVRLRMQAGGAEGMEEDSEAGLTREELRRQHRLHKREQEQQEQEEFPDEVDVPVDQAARVRWVDLDLDQRQGRT